MLLVIGIISCLLGLYVFNKGLEDKYATEIELNLLWFLAASLIALGVFLILYFFSY